METQMQFLLMVVKTLLVIGNSNAHSFDDNADNLVVGTGSGHNGITIYYRWLKFW
jgi:hypothetical protein